jgi:hypothetical protein
MAALARRPGIARNGLQILWARSKDRVLRRAQMPRKADPTLWVGLQRRRQWRASFAC